MKRAKLTIALAFLSFAFFPAYSQRNNQGEWKRYNFPKAWADYLYRTKADRSILRQNYFKDTISVEEMKAAFEQYKDTIFKTSPYAGYDSINTFYGKLLVLRSPLKDVPMKEIWMKQRKSKYAKKITGDFIFLQEPHRYMGYIVSPNPILETRLEGRLLAEEADTDGGLDFSALCSVQATPLMAHGKTKLKMAQNC